MPVFQDSSSVIEGSQERKPPVELNVKKCPLHKKPWVKEKLRWLFKITRPKNILHLCIWSVCFSLLVYFFSGILDDYVAQNPISIVTYVDQKHITSPLNVKVCNEVYLDKEKILNYNGSELGFSSYQFLYEAMSGNDNFNDSFWIFMDKSSTRFFTSTRVLDAFALDLESFLLACIVFNEDCSQSFKVFREFYNLCYDVTLEVPYYDKSNGIYLMFYFDPNITMAKYTTTLGAFVSVAHEGQYIAPSEGFHLSPNELAIVTASVTHRFQEKPLSKKDCVNSDIETHNFTGKPFQTLYNPESCIDLCYARVYYPACQCAPFVGWNLTNTECLEDKEKLSCMWQFGSRNKNYLFRSMTECSLGCLPKCNQKTLENNILKKKLDWNGYNLRNFMRNLARGLGREHPYWKVLKVNDSKPEDWDRVTPHVSQVFIRLKNEPIRIVNVVPLMNMNTFISNFGGLLGMCLGLSAISLFEFLEKVIYGAILSGRQNSVADVEST